MKGVDVFKKMGFNKLNAKKIALFFVVLILSIFSLNSFSMSYILTFNTSKSLPQTGFLIKKNEPFDKGDFVLFEFQSLDERFVKNGTRIVKKVIAKEGDKFSINENEIFINGVSFGVIKSESISGEKLFPNKNNVLEKGEYFLYAPHVDSYDSRYKSFGFVKEEQIVGKSIYEF